MNCPPTHGNRWLWLVSWLPPGYWRNFLGGPGSWLLSRLVRYPGIVAWSYRGLAWETLARAADWGEALPSEAAPFFATHSGPEALRLRAIPTRDERFADALAACLLFASEAFCDCYLTDKTGAEVYLAHHHDEIIVSVPNADAREELLNELRSAPEVFTRLTWDLFPDDEDVS
jgi:hypothetical protein